MPAEDHNSASQSSDRPGAAQAPGRAAVAGAEVPVLSLRGLSKSFGGAQALSSVELTIMPGEVMGLLGENGSGKSTLIKILNGFHAPDAGELEIAGEPVPLPLGPGQFRELGLSFVHQDLGLVPELSVLENLRVGELVGRSGGWISWGNERRLARESFARYGLNIDPRALIADLNQTERALVAIVRAVEAIRESQAERRMTHGLLVLDEPTVFLPREGTELLFATVREIVSGGHASVLFVSHDLNEVLQVTDRVTVLRDGRLQGTVRTSETTEGQLVEMIIGRALAQLVHPSGASVRHDVALSVRELSGGVVEDVAFDVRKGEIVGLTGLLGSGFDDIPYLLFGATPPRTGTMTTGGVTFDLTQITPDRAVNNGFALLPGDRQRDGSVPSLTLGDNVMLQVLPSFRRAYGLSLPGLNRRAQELLDEFDVRPADPRATYEDLSGGNQQKAIIAKWLQTKPEFIFLHEPTQGVDVGARAQIFRMLLDAAKAGASVLCASSDNEQLAAVCDRILVMARGRIAAELTGEITKERISEQVYTNAGSLESLETTTEVGN